MPHPPRWIKHPPVFRGFSLSLGRANGTGANDHIVGLPWALCRDPCAESVCPTTRDAGDAMDTRRSVLGDRESRWMSPPSFFWRRSSEGGQVFQGLAAFFFRSAVVAPTSEAMGGAGRGAWRSLYARTARCAGTPKESRRVSAWVASPSPGRRVTTVLGTARWLAPGAHPVACCWLLLRVSVKPPPREADLATRSARYQPRPLRLRHGAPEGLQRHRGSERPASGRFRSTPLGVLAGASRSAPHIGPFGSAHDLASTASIVRAPIPPLAILRRRGAAMPPEAAVPRARGAWSRPPSRRRRSGLPPGRSPIPRGPCRTEGRGPQNDGP